MDDHKARVDRYDATKAQLQVAGMSSEAKRTAKLAHRNAKLELEQVQASQHLSLCTLVSTPRRLAASSQVKLQPRRNELWDLSYTDPYLNVALSPLHVLKGAYKDVFRWCLGLLCARQLPTQLLDPRANPASHYPSTRHLASLRSTEKVRRSWRTRSLVGAGPAADRLLDQEVGCRA